MKKIKIMLVDDHKIIRDGIRLMLKNNPEIQIIAEAENGLEAIELVNKNPNLVEVILMDISMPVLDGINATKAIKAKNPKMNILVLTMHLEEAYFNDAMDAGISGYVLKEIETDELIKAITMVADNKKYVSKEVASIFSKNKRIKQA